MPHDAALSVICRLLVLGKKSVQTKDVTLHNVHIVYSTFYNVYVPQTDLLFIKSFNRRL